MNHYSSPVYTRLSEYLFNCRKNSVNVRIALVLLRKIDQFPAINIEEVALQAHTTPPSVTRFCKQLGYPRFLALKQDLQPYPGAWRSPSTSYPQPGLQEIDWQQVIHRHLSQATCRQIASALFSSRELLLLGNDNSFTCSSLLREVLTCDQRKVYQLHRQSDSQLLAPFIRQCDTVLLTDLTGDWLRCHPELVLALSRSTTICFTACPSTSFDYTLDFSSIPGFFRSQYFSSQMLVSTVCHLLHQTSLLTTTTSSFS